MEDRASRLWRPRRNTLMALPVPDHEFPADKWVSAGRERTEQRGMPVGKAMLKPALDGLVGIERTILYRDRCDVAISGSDEERVSIARKTAQAKRIVGE